MWGEEEETWQGNMGQEEFEEMNGLGETYWGGWCGLGRERRSSCLPLQLSNLREEGQKEENDYATLSVPLWAPLG